MNRVPSASQVTLKRGFESPASSMNSCFLASSETESEKKAYLPLLIQRVLYVAITYLAQPLFTVDFSSKSFNTLRGKNGHHIRFDSLPNALFCTLEDKTHRCN